MSSEEQLGENPQPADRAPEAIQESQPGCKVAISAPLPHSNLSSCSGTTAESLTALTDRTLRTLVHLRTL